ncbi:MAG: hypothetical protein NTX25_01935 [Proteobacteria bacterium]|nr:hypothetical protein [Pseudomonadota bacterium]
MAALARIKHKTGGRLRLQLSKDESGVDPWEETLHTLKQSKLLKLRESNHRTRSILIEAKDEQHLQSALDQLSHAELLSLADDRSLSTAPKTAGDYFHQTCSELDTFLRESSDNRLDLRSTTALVMAGLGLQQLLNRHFLPAGLTMVIYAIGFLEVSRKPAQAQS